MVIKKQRIRDPIHGLIVFEKFSVVDQVAWQLIQTFEFQRLRRIRQLGFSEFIFPGATHTRFIHSIGVYHNSRKFMKIVKREEGAHYSEIRASIVLIAALLHDLGHGPFSHAFEVARLELAKARGIDAIDKHEKFSAKLILDQNGGIRPILDNLDPKHFGKNVAIEVASLIEAEEPIDIYHAVVSSSFDADRLDYLVRDRYMTGTGTGHIDQDWLTDNLTKWEVELRQDDDTPEKVPTFVFKNKGRHAAEDFLLARYRLYSQVYFHKTTRGFEKLISALFTHIGSGTCNADSLGFDKNNPLWQFLQKDGEKLKTFRNLDDSIVWSALEHMSRCQDDRAKRLSKRILSRDNLEVLDISAKFGHDAEKELNAIRTIDNFIKDQKEQTAFKDEPPNNIYSRVGGEDEKIHKMVRVRTGDGGIKEITEFPDTIISKFLTEKKNLVRYYFFTIEERDAAEKRMFGG